MPNLTGTTLGQHQILEQMGRGGLTVLYRAYQPRRDRYVAVKSWLTMLDDCFFGPFQARS